MGLQPIKCPASGLYMAGIMQITGMINKRKFIIDNFFGDFTDADTKAGWADIQAGFQPFCMSKLIPTGATASKPNRQGDSTINPFNVPRQALYVRGIWEALVDKDAFIDASTAIEYSFSAFSTVSAQAEATMKWGPVLTAYEIIHEIENNISLTLEAIKPLYRKAATYNKTPSQLYFFADEYFDGHLMQGDGSLSEFPWNLIDSAFPNYVEIINNGHYADLWYEPVPEITFGAGSFSGTSDVDVETAFARRITGPGLADAHAAGIKYTGDGEVSMSGEYYTMGVN